MKKTSNHYLKRFFIVDFLATIPGQVIYLFPALKDLYHLLTYFRVVRIRKIPEAYSLLVKFFPINTTNHRIRKVEYIAALMLYYI